MPSEGEGSGLVENHNVQTSGILKPPAIPDQKPASGRKSGRNRYHKRYRKPKRMRAGDHQNRDNPGDCEVQARANKLPGRRGCHPRRHCHYRQGKRGPIRQ